MSLDISLVRCKDIMMLNLSLLQVNFLNALPYTVLWGSKSSVCLCVCVCEKEFLSKFSLNLLKTAPKNSNLELCLLYVV